MACLSGIRFYALQVGLVVLVDNIIINLVDWPLDHDSRYIAVFRSGQIVRCIYSWRRRLLPVIIARLRSVISNDTFMRLMACNVLTGRVEAINSRWRVRVLDVLEAGWELDWGRCSLAGRFGRRLRRERRLWLLNGTMLADKLTI